MLTIFSTAKPFRGHIDIIQRNAIQSWLRLNADIELILIGDEPGSAQAAREFGMLHLKEVEYNPGGAPYLNSVFGQAQNLARHEIVAYVNCDIMLMSDFVSAIRQVSSWNSRFLMVGRRWDTDIAEPWDFESPDWQEQLRSFALSRGKRLSQHAIDYFVFPRGMYAETPPFAIGRFWWDHWLIWRACSERVPVVDATAKVMAVHQNHDYAYHPGGFHGALYGEEAQANLKLAKNGRYQATLDDSTHLLTDRGIEPNPYYWLAPWRRRLERLLIRTWYPALEATKPLRYAIGLNRRRA